MPDYLLELGGEEIPAGMQPGAAAALDRALLAALADAGVAAEGSECHATPRRLTWIGRGLPAGTAAVEEVRRGPRVGAPERALAGFLRSAGVGPEALAIEGEGKGARHVLRRRIPGRRIDAHLAEIVPAVLRGLRWPKSMRWGRGDFRWVRPLRSIASVLEESGELRLVPFDLAGIPVRATVPGHPRLAPGPVAVESVAGHGRRLLAARVLLGREERLARIEAGAARLAAEHGLELVPDRGLLAELAGLVEWPVAHFGRIEPEFRELPDAVLRTAMRTHQRFLSLRDAEGRIGGYVAIADHDPADGGARIRAGYARVLRARLADAAFFWASDRRRGLERMRPALAGMVFHARLGTMADRVDRITAIAGRVADRLGADAGQVRRAAALAKCDLAAETVGEFPALQGVAGGRLAALAGEPAPVVAAIAGQYRPAGPGDAVVSDPVAASLVLADRADTLYGFFAAGLRPTGSKDPFALRRSALALLRTLEENRLRLPVAELVGWAAAAGRSLPLPGREEAAGEVVEFVLDRLAVSLRERGFPADLVAAIRAVPDSDPVSWQRRASALVAFLDRREGGEDLLAAYTRVRSILDQEGGARTVPMSDPAPDPARFRQAEEVALERARVAADGLVDAALAGEDFAAALAAMAALRPAVDAFFDQVTVNVECPELRRNRLLLLAATRRLLERVGDLARLEGR